MAPSTQGAACAVQEQLSCCCQHAQSRRRKLLKTGSLPGLQVLKRVPTLKKLDGQPVDVEEREAGKK